MFDVYVYDLVINSLVVRLHRISILEQQECFSKQSISK